MNVKPASALVLKMIDANPRNIGLRNRTFVLAIIPQDKNLSKIRPWQYLDTATPPASQAAMWEHAVPVVFARQMNASQMAAAVAVVKKTKTPFEIHEVVA